MYLYGGEGIPIPTERGQSSILGVVLLVGLVLASSALVIVVAGQATNGLEQESEKERVEQAFVQMSQEFETASTSQDVARAMNLEIDSTKQAIQYKDRGKITIEIGPRDTDPYTQDLGEIVYTADDGTKIVYQGGGVWREDESGVTAVSEPNVRFTDRTLSLPIPKVANDDQLDRGELSIEAENREQIHPGLLEETVTITITSPYYEWWATYFEDELEGVSVETDATGESVTVTIEQESSIDIVADFDQALNIDGSVVTSSGGEVTGDVYSSDNAEINSDVDGDVVSESDVHVTTSTDEVDGSVVAGGDVQIDSSVTGDVIADGSVTVDSSTGSIGGSIVSGDDVTVNNGPSVAGDIFADGSIVAGYNAIHGELYATTTIDAPGTDGDDQHEHLENIDGPIAASFGDDLNGLLARFLATETSPPPLDDEIHNLIAEGEADNEDFVTLESGETVEAGTHYVENVNINPQGGPENTLTFDVAEGDIDVIVREDIELDANAHIRVKNSDSGNVVRFYSAGDFSMSGGTSVCSTARGGCPTNDRDANVLQFYGTSESTYSFSGNSVFHGIIYAPGESSEETIAIDGGGSLELFGSVVANGFNTNGNAELTYDETLTDRYEEPSEFTDGSTNEETTIEYLNVTIYELVIKDQ